MWSDADGSGQSRHLREDRDDCFFCDKEGSRKIDVVKGVIATEVNLSMKMQAMKEIGDNDMSVIVVCDMCINRIVGSFALLKQGIQSKEEE